MKGMYSSLAIHRGPAFRASRGTALVAIGVLHAGLLAFALQQHIAPAEPEPALVSISLLAPTPQRMTQPLPTSAPRLEVPAQAILVPAQLNWDSSEDPSTVSPVAVVDPVPSQPAPLPAVPESGAPLQISQAEYLRAPLLRYPPAALSARREGSVGLRVMVGQDGRVIDVAVERSSGYPPFDEAACSAVRAALFKPYTVNGVPRVVLVRIPIDFTLKRRG
jgi:periplasmic protein TonB